MKMDGWTSSKFGVWIFDVLSMYTVTMYLCMLYHHTYKITGFVWEQRKHLLDDFRSLLKASDTPRYTANLFQNKTPRPRHLTSHQSKAPTTYLPYLDL